MKQAFLRLFFVALIVFSAPGYSLGGFPADSRQEGVHEDEFSVGPALRMPTHTIRPEILLREGRERQKGYGRYKEGEILVKFKQTFSAYGMSALHSRYGANKIKEYPALRVQHLKLKKGMSVEEAIKKYKEDPNVEYAEPNYVVTAQSLPNDPYFNQLWGLYNTGQTGGTADADIAAPEAWDITRGSNNVVVAVIDTGVDYTHGDLAANMWINTGEIQGNSVDDDGNGYVDDVYGIDVVNHDSAPMDDMGHGTHVAGTIGASGNNSLGVVGVNWNVMIIGCKFLDLNGSGYTDGAVECLQYIKALKDRGINIVATNNSWGGGGYSQALYDAIDAQRQSGILFIAAAGNDSANNDKYDAYPADFDLPNVLAVAATDSADSKASFSDYGRRTVHVGSPGVSILSTLPAQNYWSITGGYGLLSGTSMATPHVTGLAALLKSQNMNRDWRAIKNLILSGGDSIPSMDEATITGKRINAYESLGCTDSPVFSILKYPAALTAGTPTTLSALSINCASSAGPVTVTTALGETITLMDDGVSPDLAAGDGIFIATWTPSREVERLTFSSPAGTESVVTPVLVISSYLREGNVRVPDYSHTLTATGGLPPYTWAIISGSLPAGLSLDGLTGRISGAVTTTGQTLLTVQATDSFDFTVTKDLLLSIVDEPAVEEWARTYTHSGDEIALTTAVDGNGNIYVTGQSSSGDFLTVKYDSDGNVVWQKTFDRGGRDLAFAIAVDKTGNIYVGGWSNNLATGGDEGVIVKYDPAGNVVWTRVVPSGCLAMSIAVDGNNNVYVAGGGASIVKYDSAGNQIWIKGFPDILENGSGTYRITTDNNNNVYVTGRAGKCFDANCLDYIDYNLTVKYDSSGNEIWVGTFSPGDGLPVYASGMAVDNKNGYLYIVGAFLNTPGMIKYDLEGNFQWFRPEGAAYGVTVDEDGNVYLASYSCCNGYGYGFSAYGYDFSAQTKKYDVNFNLLWTKTFETVKSDVAYSIAVDKEGNVYAAGWSDDEDLDYLTIKYSGGNSLTIIKSELPSGIVGSSYSQTLTATGGKPPYSWSISSGSLPAGLSLSSSTGVISGSPTTEGCFSFIAQVTDSDNVTARSAFSLCIYLIRIDTSSLPDGITGTSYSQALTASGGQTPCTWTITEGGLPNGLSLNSSTGVISGTPTATGTSNFTVRVTDANGLTATKYFSITILLYHPVDIFTSTLPAGNIGAPYSHTVIAVGGKWPYTWSIISGSLPAGLSLNSSTGVISGTPTTAETSNFTVQAQDSFNQTATKALSIAILQAYTVTPVVNVSYPFERMWPQLAQPWYFALPAGIAVDSSGNVYVADTYNSRIQKFNSSGAYVTQWGSYGPGNGQFIPWGIAVDASDNVYVADMANNRIQKFNSNGAYVTQWGSGGSGNGQFYYPSGVAIDATGNVYVADTYNNRIQKFNSSGTYLTQWGSNGSGNGQFTHPNGVSVDATGAVYVADTNNNRVQKFNSSGTYLTQWGSGGAGNGQFEYPYGVTVDATGNVYVADRNNNRIQKFNSGGTYLSQWGSRGSGNGQFYEPQGIAVDATGAVYVADTNNNRVQKFNSSGAYLTQWGSNGSGNGQFEYPYGVTVDATGNVYVADRNNNRVQKFNSSGTYLSQWGSRGSGNGQFYEPQGIAVDAVGNVYVADYWNHRIQKFNSSGVYLTQWGSYGPGNGQVNNPNGIAVDAVGNVYVVDSGNNRIQKFNSSGTYLSQWGSYGPGNGQFDNPKGVTVDATGNVYVVDSCNHRVQKFNSSGAYLSQWGSLGSDDGKFRYPYGISVDATGNVYVADTSNNRIQKFNSSGTYLTQWGSQGSGNGQFKYPNGIAVDSSGNIQVADTGNNRIQKFNYNGPGGSLSPSTPQAAAYNATVSFTAIPDTGYHIVSVTGCSGTLSGNSFSTGPITSDCTVTATFAINTYTVTPSSGPNGSISPDTPQTVNYNATTSFTVTPNNGYHIVSISGCGGTAVGPQPDNSSYSYSTGAITSDCAVIATFAINTPNVITSTLPYGTVGSSYNQMLTATGGKTPYSWAIISGNLPADLSLNPSTGGISGVPTATGTFNFTVQVTDANFSTATKALSISIYDPLIISTTSLPAETVGFSYSQTFAATGGKTPYVWVVSSGSLPDGLSLNSASGVISGVLKTVGDYTFAVRIMDANSSTVSRQFTVSVAAQACSTSPVKIARTLDFPYDTLTAAYNAAEGFDVIEALAYSLTEDIDFSRNIPVTLKGGYDCDYTGNAWNTVIRGTLTISSGSVTVENIVLR